MQLVSLPTGVVRAHTLERVKPGSEAPQWRLSSLRGRLCELSTGAGGASLSLALTLVRQAQGEGDPVAWISASGSSFYPPDAVETGVSLERLPVIRARETNDAIRAAYHLARSGSFGLLVIDLGPRGPVPTASQARLVKLAQQHDMAVLFLTDKADAAPSIGSLISLRATSRIQRLGPARFRVELCALKDKSRAPGWRYSEVRRGPAGMR